MNVSGTDWAGSGLAWLTGLPDGPPDHSRSAVLDRAATVAADLTQLLGIGVDAATLLTGRAALLGLHRRGRTSAGGATRLMRSRDGWWALTLSRVDDIAAMPALVEADSVPDDPWPVIARWAAQRDGGDIVERAALLNLPVARVGEAIAAPVRVRPCGRRAVPRPAQGLLVADLSSMWAGPLCGRMLAAGGATVVKVESPARPDGTRSGNKAFYDWINHGKLSYALDFDRDRERLRALLAAADIVIEGSRPGALARRGLSPETLPGPNGRVWLRVSGYGQDSHRAAFGDDAAVAGGLLGTSIDGPVFCGDAIADPLTGMESALAVANSLSRGGGETLEVAMSAVAASYATLPTRPSTSPIAAAPPQPPPPTARAAELGADNAAVEAIVIQRNSVPC
ncbi:CoA transferase [Mycobacterium sp. CVI_P3]|uniref:CoA transferase n=1 Tax=Mycobacterium pinniadriaticum TaxID=2994102 RepID=A0ABT3SFQ7_9MYCO|nr:CoA transferase [Mycobacterium pinniadriaticum]MCX2931871.1 CoA transferase [Mycobacterium pinniadriaticum]MCX2938318.1 CoA transferase [Mycobacterium pinniadriaticum]